MFDELEDILSRILEIAENTAADNIPEQMSLLRSAVAEAKLALEELKLQNPDDIKQKEA